MPELYSDQFLSTINVAVPSSDAATVRAPAPNLYEQIHTGLGGEAYMLAALEAGYHMLRVKRGSEAGEKQPQTDIDRFLTSPHKANLPIVTFDDHLSDIMLSNAPTSISIVALFFGTLKGNHVYVFLHRDTGTFPFALTCHAFDPSTGAHVSQYACDYMYVTSESRDSSFEFASDGSQTAALAWYYFSRFETLTHHHPRLPSKELLTVCKNAFHARWDATKETPNR